MIMTVAVNKIIMGTVRLIPAAAQPYDVPAVLDAAGGAGTYNGLDPRLLQQILISQRIAVTDRAAVDQGAVGIMGIGRTFRCIIIADPVDQLIMDLQRDDRFRRVQIDIGEPALRGLFQGRLSRGRF